MKSISLILALCLAAFGQYIPPGGGGASTAPGGANTAIQTNGSGVFAGPTGFTWDGTTVAMTKGGGGVSTSGTVGFTTSPTGSVHTQVEGTCQNPGTGNFQAAECKNFWFGGLFNPAPYGNIAGHSMQTNIQNGFNSPNNDNKDTLHGALFDARFNGSGQRVGLGSYVYCPGVGDCGGISTVVSTQAYITASGDESNIGVSATVIGPKVLTTFTSTGLTVSSCAITALAADVTESSSSTDVKTVAVTGSTSGCAGAWLTVDYGVPGSDPLVEVLQVVSVGASTISALFRQPHSNGAPVAPAKILVGSSSDLNPAAPRGYGQGQWIVDLTATPYSTGQAAVSGTAVTGSGGASWSNSMVGGTATLVGCISFNANTVTAAPFSVNNARMWYPIVSVGGATSLTILWSYFDLDGVSTASAGSYVIRPCGRVGALTVSYGSTSNTITGLALEANPFTWTAGNTMEQSISPHIDMQHEYLCQAVFYTPGGRGNAGDCFKATNPGLMTLGSAIRIQASAKDDSTHAGWKYGITGEGNVTNAHVLLSGKSLSGIAMNLSAVDYPATIHWEGEDGADLYRGATGTGFHVDSISGKLAIGNLGTGLTGTIGTSNLTGNALFNFPVAAAGTYTLCTTTTGCGTTIGGSTGSVDNAIIRADGTGGSTLQSSTIIIGDDGTLNMDNATALRMKDNGGTSRNIISYDSGNNLVFGGTTNVASVAFAASTSASIAFSQAANTPLFIHDNNRVSVGGSTANDFYSLLVEDTIHGSTQLWVKEGGSQSGPAFAVKDASNVSKFTVDAASGITTLAGTGANLVFGGGKGQHIEPQAAASDMAGTVTITNPATTGAVTFATAYSNAPSCVITPTSNQIATVVSWWVTTSTTAVTANVQTTPGAAITFNYICFGNPN